MSDNRPGQKPAVSFILKPLKGLLLVELKVVGKGSMWDGVVAAAMEQFVLRSAKEAEGDAVMVAVPEEFKATEAQPNRPQAFRQKMQYCVSGIIRKRFKPGVPSKVRVKGAEREVTPPDLKVLCQFEEGTELVACVVVARPGT